MQQITWDVQLLSLPHVIHYCKKCRRKTEYINSRRFRVNAQGKYLDIWLIYNCAECKSTWNLTIYSRIKPTDIDSRLLNRYYCNDGGLAEQHGSSVSLIHSRGAELCSPVYHTEGPPLPRLVPVTLQIKSRHPLPVKASAILRDKLGLSQRELENLIESGQITHTAQKPLRKCKLNDEITLSVFLI